MPPRVLVACEFSGVVRDAFLARGIDAFSCDLLPSERPSSHHIRDDVRDHLKDGWDGMLSFPPCTFISSSGARWWKGMERLQEEALEFFRTLLFAEEVPLRAVENPIGRPSTAIRKPDQIIQPWQFGHPTTKATCLWLEGFPRLVPTEIVKPETHDVWYTPRSSHRRLDRSRTYPGVAAAMAAQWGPCLARSTK